jgi:hypothetical protein
MTTFFEDIEPIRYAGPDSTDPLSFRWYDADRVVGGATMAEHLRFGVCYWHSFAWDGFDIFGAGTLDRPWHSNNTDMDPMDAARMKMDAAMAMGLPVLTSRRVGAAECLPPEYAPWIGAAPEAEQLARQALTLLAEPALRAELTAAGLRGVQHMGARRYGDESAALILAQKR